MIKKITLHRWQCHHHLELDLETVTVLVGDNGSGKSAVLRALEWLALNEWEGKASEYISWGHGSCEVQLELEDSRRVSRYRSKVSNHYRLDGRKLNLHHGTRVPGPIDEILRLTSDNFQRQHDPAFWLNLSSGKAASALNDIFNLSAIDTALTSVASELRQAKTRVLVSKERLQEAKVTAQELEWTLEADTRLQELERLALEKETLAVEEAGLERQRIVLEEATVAEESLVQLITMGEKAVQASAALQEVDQEIRKLEELVRLEEEECQIKRMLEEQQDVLRVLLKGKCPLCGRG